MPRTPPKLPDRSARNGRRPTAAGAGGGMFGELAQNGRLRTIAIDQIAPNPNQPRRSFDEEKLQGLADSIAERGVLQPPVVRQLDDNQYELIAGERRWRAAGIAGQSELEVIVKDTDTAGSIQDALLENVAREGLSPIEKARGYSSLIEDLGLTREKVGKQVGESRVSVSNHLRLLDLPDNAIELIDAGELTFAHGRALLLTDDNNVRRELADQAAKEGWSTRTLEEAARAAGAPRARVKRRVSADHQHLAGGLAEAVSKATGLDIRVKASGKDNYTFTLRGHDAAKAFATKLGAELEGE